jgi:hypothetical protein
MNYYVLFDLDLFFCFKTLRNILLESYYKQTWQSLNYLAVFL